MMYTQIDKLYMYRTGRYVFKPPTVDHSNWDEDDWIRYIDMSDGWRPMGVYGTNHKISY